MRVTQQKLGGRSVSAESQTTAVPEPAEPITGVWGSSVWSTPGAPHEAPRSEPARSNLGAPHSTNAAPGSRRRWPWILLGTLLYPSLLFIFGRAAMKRDGWLAMNGLIASVLAGLLLVAANAPTEPNSPAKNEPPASDSRSSGFFDCDAQCEAEQDERRATEAEGRAAVQRNLGMDLAEMTCGEFLAVTENDVSRAETILPATYVSVLAFCRTAAKHGIADDATVDDA